MANQRIRRIRQIFNSEKLADPIMALRHELARIGLEQRLKPGMRIAVTVGSRGISELKAIIKCIVEEVQKCGAKPFILAAMGSHGGGTADGQRAVLDGYGISDQSMGVPVCCSLEVKELGRLANGLRVYFSNAAMESDGVLVVNRIKTHTAFKSDIESGLCKMLAVGLGNCEGARLVHSLGGEGLITHMVDFARLILERAPVLCGVGLIENAYKQTCRVMGGGPDEFLDIDRMLLKQYKGLMPKLPVDRVDVLFLKEIGKDISGTGMDTNVVGGIKFYQPGEYTPPAINKIIVQNLSDDTNGNAMGMGLADIITRKAYEKIDFHATYLNAAAAGFLDRVRMPMVVENDREAFELALKTCWALPNAAHRVLILKNTLKLDEIFVSRAIWEEIENRPDIEAAGPWQDLTFDHNSDLALPL